MPKKAVFTVEKLGKKYCSFSCFDIKFSKIRRQKSMKKLILFVVYVFIFCLIACENEPPSIRNPIYNIVVYEDGSYLGNKGGVFLSVHFILYDESGLEDIADIRLINTDYGYCWNLKNEDLEVTKWGDEVYYGYSFFEYDNAESVLLGNYIIRVYDKVGNVADSGILVELDDFSESIYKPTFPEYEISVKDNRKEVEIKKMKYLSCEVKFPRNPGLFKKSRKKFEANERIILSEKGLEANTLLSFRVNAEPDGKVVYFFKNFRIPNEIK